MAVKYSNKLQLIHKNRNKFWEFMLYSVQNVDLSVFRPKSIRIKSVYNTSPVLVVVWLVNLRKEVLRSGCEGNVLTFKRRIKSHLPFAGIIRRSPYSTGFQDKG